MKTFFFFAFLAVCCYFANREFNAIFSPEFMREAAINISHAQERAAMNDAAELDRKASYERLVKSYRKD